jgi:hypothetical protein
MAEIKQFGDDTPLNKKAMTAPGAGGSRGGEFRLFGDETPMNETPFVHPIHEGKGRGEIKTFGDQTPLKESRTPWGTASGFTMADQAVGAKRGK